ncbi:MAG TPA: hypothetical protein VGG74_21205 [Kofleriaceae bacterium]|jgi:predicted phage terminase large subunit-like protein
MTTAKQRAATLRAELYRREVERRDRARPLIADVRSFLRAAWPTMAGSKRLEWDRHIDAQCMHAQILVEEWHLAGLEPDEVERTLVAWEADGRPYVRDRDGADDDDGQTVAGQREHWERPVEDGGCGRGRYVQRATDLVVNVAPISLKSSIWCVVLLAWIWTWCPMFAGFFSSGTPLNVRRDSLATRDLVVSAWYRETFAIGWTLRGDQNRIDEWATTAGGVRQARGTDGSVTGVHADGIFVDDPDDAAKVWGDAARRDVMNFWKALGNRVKDPRRPLRVVLQQNVHPEDLSSRIVVDGVPRLAIPLTFVEARRGKLCTAPFGWRDRRSNGEKLQPTYYTERVRAAELKRLGTAGYNAQYECDPSPADGTMFRRGWWRFFRPIVANDATPVLPPRARPEGCVGSGAEFGTLEQHPSVAIDLADLEWFELSVDASFGSTSATASEVSLQVIGGYGANRFVFDDDTEVRSWPQTIAAVREKIRSWGVARAVIERKANGQAVIDSLVEAMLDQEHPLLGPDGEAIAVVVEPIDPDESKESRWAAMSPEVEAGCWFLLDGATWSRDYVDQFAALPQARRNDRADASAQIATRHRSAMSVEERWRALAGLRAA